MHSYRNQVLFTQAAQAIPKDAILVEIGPHSILRSPLRQSRPDLPYVSLMRKGECGLRSLRDGIADLWRRGAAIKWPAPPLSADAVEAERAPSLTLTLMGVGL